MRNLTRVNDSSNSNKYGLDHHEYSQLKTHYDKKNKIGWLYMDALPRACFTPQLLNDIAHYHQHIQLEMEMTDQTQYDYIVLASDEEGTFSLGRDLELIYQLIQQKNREKLILYAKNCLAPLYQHITHLSANLTTISLVQGDALGGGFEAALSTDLLIAERGTKFGFPEILFNSFPCMGGLSLLNRRVGSVVAENIMLSGQLFTAEALYEIGIIDILAEKGEGELELYKFIKGQNQDVQQQQIIRKVKQACNPISYQELFRVTEIWVDAILKTNDKDLRMMQRFITRQSRPISS
ncbi:MAG: DSF synthase [Methylophagaceae bacterium]|jgi:DSF synthase